MNAKQIITIAAATAGANQAELARRLGMSAQLFNQRIAVGKFTLEEWQRIAAALGASLRFGFVFPNGRTVEL